MPQPQDNLKRAECAAFDALVHQSAAQMAWLGAERTENLWRLPVLETSVVVDLAGRRLTTSAGQEVGAVGGFLCCTTWPSLRSLRAAPEITFADLPAARTYAGVYQHRAIARLSIDASGIRPQAVPR